MARQKDKGDNFPSDVGDVAPTDPTTNLSHHSYRVPKDISRHDDLRDVRNSVIHNKIVREDMINKLLAKHRNVNLDNPLNQGLIYDKKTGHVYYDFDEVFKRLDNNVKFIIITEVDVDGDKKKVKFKDADKTGVAIIGADELTGWSVDDDAFKINDNTVGIQLDNGDWVLLKAAAGGIAVIAVQITKDDTAAPGGTGIAGTFEAEQWQRTVPNLSGTTLTCFGTAGQYQVNDIVELLQNTDGSNELMMSPFAQFG